MDWSVVYLKAIQDDGTLLFPERLSREFLDNARKTMGSYIFANQYQNEIIPTGETPFRKEWLRYYKELPTNKFTFAFIDPAISTENTADYTGVVVVDVDAKRDRYLRIANRYRINPTQIVNLVFDIQKQYSPMCIGIEDVAYQKALLYMLDGEMRRRGVVLPVKGVRPPTDKSKEIKILGLVPHFEWGRILIAQGLHDFEMEYLQFPRAAHDDLLDALASLDEIIFYPTEEGKISRDPAPNSKDYERFFIANKLKAAAKRDEPSEPEYDPGDY